MFEALLACDLRGLTRDVVRGLVGGAPPWSILETRDATADGPSTEASGPLGGHRRQLTALCCRLRVRGASTVDGEALDDRIRGAIGLCADVARRHGGHMASALGDDLLFYFGYPRAAEDDARRAARAALAMAEAVVAEGNPLAGGGARIDVGVGVHTGLVVAGGPASLGGATLVVGATPRLAAALASLADPARSPPRPRPTPCSAPRSRSRRPGRARSTGSRRRSRSSASCASATQRRRG